MVFQMTNSNTECVEIGISNLTQKQLSILHYALTKTEVEPDKIRECVQKHHEENRRIKYTITREKNVDGKYQIDIILSLGEHGEHQPSLFDLHEWKRVY